jgi:nucleotide-binding universal stress UspA family protein
MPFQRILVALDGSERAARVLDSAVELAQAAGGKLVLLRAVGLPVEVMPEVFVLPPDQLEGELGKHAQADLEKLAARVPPALLDHVDVATGVAWQVICERARALDADLIVIGSHGYRGLDRVLGTTAARVVNHADRAVLVTRDRSPHPAHR